MKKLLIIGLLAFAFQSCEKDSGSNDVNNDPDPTTIADADFNYKIVAFRPF